MILCCASHPSGFSSSTGAFANRKGRAVAAATAPKFAGSAGVKRAPRAVMPLGFRYRRHRARQRVEGRGAGRSEEHTSELQSLMRISYAVFCLKKKTNKHTPQVNTPLLTTIHNKPTTHNTKPPHN